MKKTYDELVELLEKALERIDYLEAENKKLREKLNKNSRNSSKPPSSDQKANSEDKPKKQRASRKGFCRLLFSKDQIDKVIECNKEICPKCGSKHITDINSSEILQQVELPECKAIVTEYILKKHRCKCCANTFKSDLPAGIPHSSFGSKLMSLVSTLTGVFHLAKRESIQLLKELYGIDIGLGSLPNIETKVSRSLELIYQRIHQFILTKGLVKYFDETSWRDSGKKHYAWIATNKEAAFYQISRRRNSEAFRNLIKNSDITNHCFVSDRYAVYAKGIDHQFCLAHLIRDFKAFSERDGPDKKIGSFLVKYLKKACFIHGQYCKEKISILSRNQQLGKIKKKVEYWLMEGCSSGSDALFSISNRLLDSFEKMWMFVKINGMEPTNNIAERDLRKLVIWRKKSYGTRSLRGQKFVERITAISQTLRKQGRSILNFIQEAIQNFYSKKTAPLINPSLGF